MQTPIDQANSILDEAKTSAGNSPTHSSKRPHLPARRDFFSWFIAICAASTLLLWQSHGAQGQVLVENIVAQQDIEGPIATLTQVAQGVFSFAAPSIEPMPVNSYLRGHAPIDVMVIVDTAAAVREGWLPQVQQALYNLQSQLHSRDRIGVMVMGGRNMGTGVLLPFQNASNAYAMGALIQQMSNSGYAGLHGRLGYSTVPSAAANAKQYLRTYGRGWAEQKLLWLGSSQNPTHDPLAYAYSF